MSNIQSSDSFNRLLNVIKGSELTENQKFKANEFVQILKTLDIKRNSDRLRGILSQQAENSLLNLVEDLGEDNKIYKLLSANFENLKDSIINNKPNIPEMGDYNSPPRTQENPKPQPSYNEDVLNVLITGFILKGNFKAFNGLLSKIDPDTLLRNLNRSAQNQKDPFAELYR